MKFFFFNFEIFFFFFLVWMNLLNPFYYYYLHIITQKEVNNKAKYIPSWSWHCQSRLITCFPDRRRNYRSITKSASWLSICMLGGHLCAWRKKKNSNQINDGIMASKELYISRPRTPPPPPQLRASHLFLNVIPIYAVKLFNSLNCLVHCSGSFSSKIIESRLFLKKLVIR